MIDIMSPSNAGPFLPEIPQIVEPVQPQLVPLGEPISRVQEAPAVGLQLSLRFRNTEVFQHAVTNGYGCRLYFGDNIPDISQLVEPEHMSNITRPFRYQPEQLFGPDYLEQVSVSWPISLPNFQKSLLTKFVITEADCKLIDKNGIPVLILELIGGQTFC